MIGQQSLLTVVSRLIGNAIHRDLNSQSKFSLLPRSNCDNMDGKLIVIEGVDKAGKTTQILKISNWLNSQGILNLISSELTTPIGPFIRANLGCSTFTAAIKAMLFAADRLYRFQVEVEPSLKSNVNVLADRWVLSSLAYQGVEGLDSKFILALNALVRSPDLIILIDIAPDEAWRRGQIEEEPIQYSLPFLKKVRQKYVDLAKKSQIPIINGMQSPEIVFSEIIQVIYTNLGKFDI